MTPKTTLLLTFILLLHTLTAAAGPWTKSPGEIYLKVGEGLFLSDSYRDSNGDVVQGDIGYLGATTSLYFEVGIWRGIHVWGYLPYLIAINNFHKEGHRTLNAGGGDALLGLQYTPPLPLPFPAALKLELKLPFYDVGGTPPLFPAPGDGQLDVTFWLSVGGSLHPTPLYFFGELGYRHRSEAFIGDGGTAEFHDGVAFFVSMGYAFGGRYILALNSGGILPFEASQSTKGYVTLGPALYLPITKGLAAEASFDPMIYTNKNTAPGLGFSLGLSFKN